MHTLRIIGTIAPIVMTVQQTDIAEAVSRRGGGVSSLGFSFANQKTFSNLHPYKCTPLIPPLVMQSTQNKACLTNKSERLPTSQSVQTSEMDNN